MHINVLVCVFVCVSACVCVKNRNLFFKSMGLQFFLILFWSTLETLTLRLCWSKLHTIIRQCQ